SSTSTASAGGGGGSSAGCAPGEMALEDGTCRAAGLPPDTPKPGPTAEPTAGIPPDGCAEGFAYDGDARCLPILPNAPCPDGMYAVPGETSCHAVGTCGAAPWGDAPVGATTQYVDAAFVGLSDGSALSPWKTIQDAADAAAPGALIAIAAGTYP